MGKIFLIDAYAIIYRSYYALIKAPRINSKGLNTSAIMGFCNTLNEIMQKEKPTHLAVAFDHGKTFRHEAFAEYKAQREEPPEDIRASIPIIKDILQAYNIPILQVEGYEADDIIGTVAKMAENDGMDVFMLTPDKDYAQLVTDKIHMYRPRHGGGYENMGPKEVCEKYGIETTSQVIDLLGLMGDSSDNYQGCPGVGEKTAVKLINEFGNIEGLLSRSSELKGKMREKVESSVDDIRLSKYLATIRQDVPVDVPLNEMTVKEANKEKLRKIFDELEFKKFAEKLLGTESTNANKPSQKQKSVNIQPSFFGDFFGDGQESSENSNYEAPKTSTVKVQTLENEEEISNLCRRFATSATLAFDVKSSSSTGIDAQMLGISLADNDSEAYFIKISPSEEKTSPLLLNIKKVLENAQATMIVQNAKLALEVLSKYDIQPKGTLWDTMIAHYLINPDLHHNKEYMSEEFAPDRVAKVFGQKASLEKQLQESNMEQLFREVEMPLVPVLAEMEMTGVRLDTKELARVQQEMNERANQIEREIYELAGESFNIASPKQVGDILFGKLQIMEKPKKTKTGQFVTSEEVLQQLRPKNPIVGKILDHRALKKLLGTYVEALPKLINPNTGHVHTSFNQCVTATGRLSSSDPNLQNIPVRSEDGKEIRRCFIPEEGEEFFSCDYSQVELRIMASLSGDKHMIEAFLEGHDIHAATSAKIFHKSIDEVTKDERRKAKSANFGIIYGISAFGLAQGLDIDRREAKELIDGYFESFPEVQQFIERCKDEARQKGYAETIMGRRRYLPDINSKNGTVRAFAERNAVNAPIQGTAADIMKVAMIRVWQRLKAEGLKTKLILQVHDELNFSVPQNEREQVERIVKEEMQNACHLAVPLIADGGWGSNWLEAH
ncbi:MAG: DNA polymerase I [Prevotella sp.]|nr:DNA polymerase I [Prevotella sp.]